MVERLLNTDRYCLIVALAIASVSGGQLIYLSEDTQSGYEVIHVVCRIGEDYLDADGSHKIAALKAKWLDERLNGGLHSQFSNLIEALADVPWDSDLWNAWRTQLTE